MTTKLSCTEVFERFLWEPMELRIRSLEALVGDLREARFVVNTGPPLLVELHRGLLLVFRYSRLIYALGRFWEAAYSLHNTCTAMESEGYQLAA